LGFGDVERISSHGVRRELLDAQTYALNLPVEVVHIPPACSNADYEASFGAALQRLQARGITRVAAGDLFLEDVRAYRATLFQKFGMEALFPLWGRGTTRVAHEFIGLGFKAVLSCVDTSALDASFAGRDFDDSLLRDLPVEVDPCGENGEFHTFVYNGPNFAHPVAFERGEVVLPDDRFAFCELLAL
jgi:diphthamide synthase (EF-2-diphthine--ammonia ligase)